MRTPFVWSLALFTLVSAPAAAQGVVPVVLEAPGLPDAAVRRLQKAAEGMLKQVSGWSVSPSPTFRRDAPRKSCSQDCQREVARAQQQSAVILLALKGQSGSVLVDASVWVDGERVGGKSGEAELESPETGLLAVLEPVVPAWAKRGFGGLKVDAPTGAVVKVDGRASGKVGAGPGVLPVPAGAHQVDVVYPDGHAVLQKLEVPEGSRTYLEPESPLSLRGSGGGGRPALRYTSYGLFTAGALGIAGGLVAGALARHAGGGQSSCLGDSRTCPTLEMAMERHRQADAYARTGNILLIVGGALAAVGAGLFTIDALTSGPSAPPAEATR